MKPFEYLVTVTRDVDHLEGQLNSLIGMVAGLSYVKVLVDTTLVYAFRDPMDQYNFYHEVLNKLGRRY